MLVPFDSLNPSNLQFYLKYYGAQNGNGSYSVHQGVTQRGRGIGGLFSGLLKSALPILKSSAKTVGKELLNTGMNVMGDMMKGEKFSDSAKKRFRGAAGNLLDEVQKTVGGSRAKKRSKGYSTTTKKRRRKTTGRDIFAENGL